MDELDNILQKLGIYENFDLLGHSWGGLFISLKKQSYLINFIFSMKLLLGMLGGQYAATQSPKGLKRLILSHSPSSIKLADQGSASLLRKDFGPDIADMMHKHEAEGTIDNPEYQKINMQFAHTHMWPSDLNASFAAMGKDPTVSGVM